MSATPKPESSPADSRQIEFDELQKQQWTALDRAIYFGMTAKEAQEYESRARRIVALQQILGANLRIPPRRQ